MSNYKPSLYTSIMQDEHGNHLLYNSFMGAVARVKPSQIPDFDNYVLKGIPENVQDNPLLKELCQGGFFIPSDKDEATLVSAVLKEERNATFRMIILPTEKCNFRCVYCYEDYQKGVMQEDVIEGLKILSNRMADRYRGISVSWFGGEPLLAKETMYDLSKHFIAVCKKKSITYNSSIVSNGYLMTPRVFASLLKHEIKYFQITLDGPEHIHNKTRRHVDGKGTYNKILNNLEQMRTRQEDFTVRIRINFNNTSIPLLEQWLHKDIAPLFENDHRFTVRVHAIGKWGGKNDSALETCDSKTACQLKHNFIKNSSAFGSSNEAIKQYLKPHGNVCYAGKDSSLVVGSDGSIYKCTVAFNDPRNQVGRLKKDGTLLLDSNRWNQWTTLSDEDTKRCYSCLIYPSCQGRSCPLAKLKNGRSPCPLSTEELKSLVAMVSPPVTQTA